MNVVTVAGRISSNVRPGSPDAGHRPGGLGEGTPPERSRRLPLGAIPRARVPQRVYSVRSCAWSMLYRQSSSRFPWSLW